MRTSSFSPKTVASRPFLEITCTDCGHGVVWTRTEIDYFGIAPETTIENLGSHLFCSRCRQEGGRGLNLEITPRWTYPDQHWRRRCAG
jgi:hypothetical protein